MAARKPPASKLHKTLRTLALRKPDVTEGVACEGTALESVTFGVGKKVFLFLRLAEGTTQIRLKLAASQAEARRLAATHPDGYALGAQGWAKVTFGTDGTRPPLALLERWLEESYRTVVGPRPAALRKTMPPPAPRKSMPPSR